MLDMIQNPKDNMQEQNLIQMECNSWLFFIFLLLLLFFFAVAVAAVSISVVVIEVVTNSDILRHFQITNKTTVKENINNETDFKHSIKSVVF